MQETYKRPNGKTGVRTINNEPSLTEQQFKDDCDATIIIARMLKTGTMPKFASRTGVYADLTELPGSYQEALDLVREAEQAFMGLPSILRTKFDNNPQKLIDFLADPKMMEESYALGLRVKQPEPDAKLKDVVEAIKDTVKRSEKPSEPAANPKK